MEHAQSGINELRYAVHLLNNCSESFNQRHSVEDLLKICRAYAKCAYAVPPDLWTDEQLAEALAGRVPTEASFAALGY